MGNKLIWTLIYIVGGCLCMVFLMGWFATRGQYSGQFVYVVIFFVMVFAIGKTWLKKDEDVSDPVLWLLDLGGLPDYLKCVLCLWGIILGGALILEAFDGKPDFAGVINDFLKGVGSLPFFRSCSAG